jgi:hypothetical protein
VRFFVVDGSTFLNGDYLIKGVGRGRFRIDVATRVRLDDVAAP